MGDAEGSAAACEDIDAVGGTAAVLSGDGKEAAVEEADAGGVAAVEAADAVGWEDALSGEGRRAVKEAGPDSCLVCERPVS